MAEQKNRPYRRRNDPALQIQRLLAHCHSPEEALFKINELLYQSTEDSTRRNVRAPVSLPVSYRVGNREFNGLLYTLSQEGMFIKSPKPLPENTLLDLELILPGDEKTIAIEGEVVHRTSLDDARRRSGISGMTVVFRKIRGQDQRRIDRFVRSRARQIFKP